MGAFSFLHWFIILFALCIYIVPMWVIVRKAGYPGALSLLMLVPVLNIIALWFFAFSNWPKTR